MTRLFYAEFKCECDPVGSIDFRCDEETGQCACQQVEPVENENSRQIVAGLTGRQCDKCDVRAKYSSRFLK